MFANDMLAIDTNILVRLVVRDDSDQVEAAQKFVRKGAWISYLVLEIAKKAGNLPVGTFDGIDFRHAIH